MWRRSQSQGDLVIGNSEEIVDTGDWNQITELIDSKMIVYMEHIERATE